MATHSGILACRISWTIPRGRKVLDTTEETLGWGGFCVFVILDALSQESRASLSVMPLGAWPSPILLPRPASAAEHLSNSGWCSRSKCTVCTRGQLHVQTHYSHSLAQISTLIRCFQPFPVPLPGSSDLLPQFWRSLVVVSWRLGTQDACYLGLIPLPSSSGSPLRAAPPCCVLFGKTE